MGSVIIAEPMNVVRLPGVNSESTVTAVRAQDFTFIDLFAGIGGFHVALSELGGTCVFASEIDPECQTVYGTRWPGTRLVGDIHAVTESGCLDVPPHDVLCAGFPCQPFSKSGFQMGLRDRTRGTLFFEIMEIVRVHRPKLLILENVRNIAGPRHRQTWRVIIDSLREEHYRVPDEPVVFSPHLLPNEPPSFDGRPQVRDRVFILAEYVGPGGDVYGEPLVPRKPVGGWNPKNWSLEPFLDNDSDIPNLAEFGLRESELKWLTAWEEFVRMIDDDPLPGFPIWVDAFETKSRIPRNCPDWKADFLRKNSTFYIRHKRRIDLWRRRHSVDDFPASRRKFEWQARGYPHSLWNLLIHMRPSGIRVKPPTYVPALVAITQTSIYGPRRRRLTPREAARLQGFPDDFELHPSSRVAYRQLGNAVSVGVVKHMAVALFAAAETRERARQELLLVV